MQSGTECRNGVPGRLALVLRDGRDPHFARAEQQVAILGQIPAASCDAVHRQVDPLRDHVLSGPLSEQGISESIHDGDVVSGLGGSDISVKPQAIGIHHVPTLRRACDANSEVSSILSVCSLRKDLGYPFVQEPLTKGCRGRRNRSWEAVRLLDLLWEMDSASGT